MKTQLSGYSSGLSEMLFIVFVGLYSLTVHCVSPVDARDLSNVDTYDKLLGPVTLLEVLQPLRLNKRPCTVALHSHNCHYENLEKAKISGEYLSSADSPGKRAALAYELKRDEFPDVYHNVLENDNFLDYGYGYASLDGPVLQTRQMRKRDCRFRLGGHCITEALDRAANQYYYLKSSDSPGRRRRDTNPNRGQA